MTYQKLYAHIDYNFPCHDAASCQQLIVQLLEIGGDAPFLVLHVYWKSAFSHPMQDIVEPASMALIQQRLLSDEEVIRIMEQLRTYSQLSSALQVALFACADEQGLVDAKYEEIVSEWQRL
ncbi:MAG: hypothetical protein WAQ53_07425 [Thiofilum sp.]|uniref:hypothetical protein n=1 Tax=Thiofilum sp. TaxID=2212733 RepID=UPI0025D4AF67|nr:hypothetical protein [Thiofilum sp.]MBK8453443.1 hypothetical protein [Thiofilum sp.]